MKEIAISKQSITKGVYGSLVCRTRYIDDAAREVLTNGNDQLVILDTGIDTRPYRMPGVECIRGLEVDRLAVQNEKKHDLQKLLGRVPEKITYIPIVFNQQSLESVFAGTGFDPSRPAVRAQEK